MGNLVCSAQTMREERIGGGLPDLFAERESGSSAKGMKIKESAYILGVQGYSRVGFLKWAHNDDISSFPIVEFGGGTK